MALVQWWFFPIISRCPTLRHLFGRFIQGGNGFWAQNLGYQSHCESWICMAAWWAHERSTYIAGGKGLLCGSSGSKSKVECANLCPSINSLQECECFTKLIFEAMWASKSRLGSFQFRYKSIFSLTLKPDLHLSHLSQYHLRPSST